MQTESIRHPSKLSSTNVSIARAAASRRAGLTRDTTVFTRRCLAVSSGTCWPIVGCSFLVMPSHAILSGYLLLPCEKGICFNDDVEVANNGYRLLCIAASTEVPLQIADPKNKIGDDSSARIEFDAEKFVRINSETCVFQCLLSLTKSLKSLLREKSA